jgi:hypothetical protein
VSLLNELADAEARVERLRLQVAQGTCAEVGHDWRLLGGKNAGCCDDCGCSVPVRECAKCGDCDYGDTPEADEIRARCGASGGEGA